MSEKLSRNRKHKFFTFLFRNHMGLTIDGHIETINKKTDEIVIRSTRKGAPPISYKLSDLSQPSLNFYQANIVPSKKYRVIG